MPDRSTGSVCLSCWGAERGRQRRGRAGSSSLFLGNLIRVWLWNSPSDLNKAFRFLKDTPTREKAGAGSIAAGGHFCPPARASPSAGILIPVITALTGRAQRGRGSSLSRAEPRVGETSRTEPSEVEPSRGKANRTEPSGAEPSRARRSAGGGRQGPAAARERRQRRAAAPEQQGRLRNNRAGSERRGRSATGWPGSWLPAPGSWLPAPGSQRPRPPAALPAVRAPAGGSSAAFPRAVQQVDGAGGSRLSPGGVGDRRRTESPPSCRPWSPAPRTDYPALIYRSAAKAALGETGDRARPSFRLTHNKHAHTSFDFPCGDETLPCCLAANAEASGSGCGGAECPQPRPPPRLAPGALPAPGKEGQK